jgi:copper(I)-binding protein
MKTSIIRFAITLFLLVGMPTTLAAENSLAVQNPWVREAPPGSKVLAAYLVVENNGTQMRTLSGAGSPAFKRLEMHKTEVRGGVARMLRQEKVEIPGEGRVTFESGGYHLMLIEPIKPLREDDHVDLSLSFSDGEIIRVNAVVRKASENREPMNGIHNMDTMNNMGGMEMSPGYEPN